MSDSNARHIISILLDNEAGALSRVAGLFSARGYNIESLTVAETEDPLLSRMTIVTLGAEGLIEQIVNQLNKLIDVVKVQNLSKNEFVEREILLAKVQYSGAESERKQLTELIKQHQSAVIVYKEDICLLELTATSQEIEEFIQALDGWNLIEVVRSGVVGFGADTIIL